MATNNTEKPPCAECSDPRRPAMKYTELMRAAARGHEACVTALIHDGADVNAVDNGVGSDGVRILCRCDTALLEAVRNGNTKCAEIVINAGADVNVRGKDNDSALIRSALNGDLKIVDLLINAGADVNFVNMYNYSALIAATRNGHDLCVKSLLQAGADVNISPDSMYSALTEAAIHGRYKCLELLKNTGTDHVSVASKYGMRALIGTAEAGHNTCLSLLLGADVNAKEQLEQSADCMETVNKALVRTAFNGHAKCVKVLIGAGADVNYHNQPCNSDKGTASNSADAGNDVNNALLFNLDGVGVSSVMAPLLESISAIKSSVTQLNQWLQNTMQTVQAALPDDAVLGFSQALQQFKFPEFDMNPSAVGGNTALIGAAGSGSAECVKILLEAGAKVNDSNCKGKTPLMIASAFCSIRSIALLLGQGAHVNKRDTKGQNALEMYITESFTKSKSALGMMLYAAGENIAGNTVHKLDDFLGKKPVKVPKYLIELNEPSLCLKDISRKYVRQYLLGCSALNLFCQVPKLEPFIPSILVEYLLYDITLENYSQCAEDDFDKSSLNCADPVICGNIAQDDSENDDDSSNGDDDTSTDDDSDDDDNDSNALSNVLNNTIFRTYPPLGIPSVQRRKHKPLSGLNLGPVQLPVLPPMPPLPQLPALPNPIEFLNSIQNQQNAQKENAETNDNEENGKSAGNSKSDDGCADEVPE